MDFDYSFDGNTYAVKIDNDSKGKYRTVINEEVFEFYASIISPNEYSIIHNNKNIKIYAAETEESLYVHILGKVIRLQKPGENKSGYGEGDHFGAKDEVSTPMPGKVVKILVKEGEKITAGQSLVIVESMKMENEIKSPSDGEVKSIHYTDGDLVEPGQPIIKINPAE